MPPSFLVFATEWKSGHGGLSTFNRHLCSALARAHCEVTCIVPECADQDIADAHAHNVELAMPRCAPGLNPERKHDLLLVGLARGRQFDVVVGHGRVTGPHAVTVRDRDYPEARYVHFIHMDAKSIEWEKLHVGAGDPAVVAKERTRIETQLSVGAVLAMAVGPRLAKRFATYLHSAAPGRTVHEYRPGLLACAELASAPPERDCLLFGRVDDYMLKGVDLAAKALGAVMARDESLHGARLVVLGAAMGESRAIRKRILDDAPKLNVDVEPYTSDAAEVLDSIRRATLVLMPSRTEGFGLAGLEAISQGVPVLISASSGLADALKECVPAIARAHIVDVTDPDDLERGIRSVLDRPEEAFRNVQTLRAAMEDHFSWDKSTASFLALLQASKGPATPVPALPYPSQDPIENLVAAMSAASNGLTQWPQTLVTGAWLERSELPPLVERLCGGERTRLWLLGSAGSGKSAFLARLVESLKDRGIAVLAVKADQVPHDVDGIGGLSAWLKLFPTAADVIEAVARTRRVVVVVDQLDALADIVDQKTRRLGALLEFARIIGASDNVSIVASCRPFDFERDIRFRELAYEEMSLSEPSADAVNAVLVERGVTLATVPPKLHRLLAAPHWLNVFLRIVERGREDENASEHALLEALWRQTVGSGDANHQSETALAEIAIAMGDTEELWVPVAQFGNRSKAIEYLEHHNILRHDASGSRIAFAHQTFFEFARARAFVAAGYSLTGYVHDKGYSLFVRPVLWSALAYLRASSQKKYQADLGELLVDADMRPHLVALVLQFLGEQTKPTLAERRALLVALDSPGRHRLAIGAVAGKPAWFGTLEPRLPSLMSSHPGSAHVVLEPALAFVQTKVVRLLRKHWLPVADQHSRIARILSRAAPWSKDVVELAQALIEAGSLPEHVTSLLVTTATKRAPNAAVVMVGIELRALLKKHVAKMTPQMPLALDATDSERAMWHVGQEPRRTMEAVLRDACGLHGLLELSREAPLPFLKEVWPWFEGILEQATDEDKPNALIFRRDYIHEADLDDPHTFGAFMSSALLSLARGDAAGFKRFLIAHADSSLDLVHRALIAGLIAGLPATRALAVKYLSDDPRRLTVGETAPGSTSMGLLRAIAPQLNAAESARIVAAIETLRLYDDSDPERDARNRRDVRQYNERHRVRLLQALEPAPLSARVRSRLMTPDPSDEPPTNHSVALVIGSHVSAEQMARMKDKHIIGLFEALPDATGSDHPTRFLSGGSSQAAQVFGAVVKGHPERHARYAALLKKFSPETQQRPATYGFDALLESGYGLANAERLLAELDDLGFKSEEFRTTAAYALEKLAHAETEADPATLARLESWLSDATETEPVRDASDKRRTILWGGGGGGILPRGNYPILSVLTVLLLVRPEPRFDDWVDLLLLHLKRRESPRVLSMLARRFRYMRRASNGRGERFLVELFEQYPEVRDSAEGVRLIAASIGWVSTDTIDRWMQAVRVSAWGMARRAFGEVSALIGTNAATHSWAQTEIEAAFLATGDHEIRRGMVTTAVRVWNEPERRANATGILVNACALAETQEDFDEIMRVLDVSDEVMFDVDTKRLLYAMLQNPRVLAGRSIHFADRLSVLLAEAPETVCELARAYVAQRMQPGAASGDLFSTGPKLVDLSLTLQRLDRTIRARGLDLFEQLLEAEAYGTRDVLAELDAGKRTASEPPPV